MNLHQTNLGSMLADVTTQRHASGCTMCTFGNEIVKAFLEGANVTDTVTSIVQDTSNIGCLL